VQSWHQSRVFRSHTFLAFLCLRHGTVFLAGVKISDIFLASKRTIRRIILRERHFVTLSHRAGRVSSSQLIRDVKSQSIHFHHYFRG